MPFVVAPSLMEHASQAPLQLVLQQKPSTQFPDVHDRSDVQVVPFDFRGMQLPLEHHVSLVQPWSFTQEVGHPGCVPLQT